MSNKPIFQKKSKYNQVNWAVYLATIGFGTVGGAIISGLPGGAIGLATSVLDEYLIKGDYTTKHYLSTSAYWLTMVFTPAASLVTKIYPNLKIPFYLGSYVVAGITSYYANDFINFKNKIELPIDSFLTVNKLFDEKEIISGNEFQIIYYKLFENPSEALNRIVHDMKEIYNNDFLFTFIEICGLKLVNIIINNLLLKFLASYSANLFISQLIVNHNVVLSNYAFPTPFSLSGLAPLRAVFMEAGKIIGAIIIKDVVENYIQLKESQLTKSQINKVIKKSADILFKNSNGKKILADESGREIIKQLTNDLYKLIFHGANKLIDVLSESTKFLISLKNLVELLPEASSLYTISLIPYQIYLGSILNYSQELAKNISKAYTEALGIRNEITGNIQQISLRDGEEFLKYQYNAVLTIENEFNKAAESHNKIKNFISSQIKNFEMVIDTMYFGYKFIINQIDVAQIPLIKHAVKDITSFLSSNLNSQIDNTDLIISKERITKMLEIIFQTSNSAKHIRNDLNKIIFKNYSLMLDDKILVKIDYFEFTTTGKHYAITGASGCGKTSMLIDLKDGVFGALSSSGEISIPHDSSIKPKIMFIDQKLYLPKDSSLLETIYFPNVLALLNEEQVFELRNKIISLLKELCIDEFINNPNNDGGLLSRLDSKEFKLSGGQEKKIAIMQAIINKPTILIMDETFAGLDKGSLIKVQKAIIKYLPYTGILSIDHHAEDNNYNGFYHSKVHFANNSITEQAIAFKVFEELRSAKSYNQRNNWVFQEECPLKDTTLQCLIGDNPGFVVEDFAVN